MIQASPDAGLSEAERTPLVLDTHVLLWLVNKTGDLARRTVGRIDRAADRGDVVVSAIAIWEIAMLVRKGRLKLGESTRDWVAQALSRPGVRMSPLTPEIAIESEELPGRIHGDPADRIIIATARALDATLVTRDQLILAYGAQGHVEVLPA
ncbi:MAG: type II toxin-antitoxin system VapC family toxin [Kiloniellales bacterium]